MGEVILPNRCHPEGDYSKLKANKKFVHSFLQYSLPHIQRWTEMPFRVGEFPLVEDGKVQYDIQKFWQPFIEAGLIDFAEDSNCQFCFWKRVRQLRENWDRQPGIMGCAAVVESMLESTLLAKMSLLDFKNTATQLNLFQMHGEGVKAALY